MANVKKRFDHNKLCPETAFTNIAMFSLFFLLILCPGRRRLHLTKVDFRRRTVPTLDQASCVGGTTHSWNTWVILIIIIIKTSLF